MIIVNIFRPNNKLSKYMKKKLTELRGEIDKSTLRVGDFNIPFLEIYGITRKSSKIQRNG